MLEVECEIVAELNELPMNSPSNRSRPCSSHQLPVSTHSAQPGYVVHGSLVEVSKFVNLGGMTHQSCFLLEATRLTEWTFKKTTLGTARWTPVKLINCIVLLFESLEDGISFILVSVKVSTRIAANRTVAVAFVLFQWLPLVQFFQFSVLRTAVCPHFIAKTFTITLMLPVIKYLSSLWITEVKQESNLRFCVQVGRFVVQSNAIKHSILSHSILSSKRWFVPVDFIRVGLAPSSSNDITSRS
jgi:hypothetical protein